MSDGIATHHAVIDRLAGFGPRVAGTAAETRAATYLVEQLQGLGLEAWLQPFKFVGWEQTTPARVTLSAPDQRELRAGSMAYTDSTPPGGVTGRLVKIGTAYICPGFFEWPKYAVVDDAGAEVAFLLGHVDGHAIPMPDVYPDRIFMEPTVNIGHEDARQIDAWLEAGETIRVAVETAGRFVPGLTSHNVLARLPGRSTDEIVVSSHIDTAPGAPGAIDNASGTQCLYDVAARLVARGTPEKTFIFAAFGGEEYFLLGSSWYVADRKTRGTLDQVVANLNLDTVGVGNTILCMVARDGLRREVEAAMDRAGTRERFAEITFSPPRRAVDNFPFHEEGIPNMVFVVWPYDEYHQPGDNLDLVDHDVVDHISELACDLAIACDGASRDDLWS
jgi:aminopeptidase YwaD